MTALVTSSSAPALFENNIRDHFAEERLKPLPDPVGITYGAASQTSAVRDEQERGDDARLGAVARHDVMRQQIPHWFVLRRSTGSQATGATWPAGSMRRHEDRGGQQGQQGQQDQRGQGGGDRRTSGASGTGRASGTNGARAAANKCTGINTR